jgi:hypothetical protein
MMYLIGKWAGSRYEVLPGSPSFSDDELSEAQKWATFYMHDRNIPFAGSPDSVQPFHVPENPTGVLH